MGNALCVLLLFPISPSRTHDMTLNQITVKSTLIYTSLSIFEVQWFENAALTTRDEDEKSMLLTQRAEEAP